MSDLDTSPVARTLGALLQLDRHPGGATGRCHAGAPGRVFGGHIAAQALVAATPPDADDRTLHSMHAYFVAAARPDEPVTYDVADTRDSRSFTVRQVTAHQFGVPVLTLSCSAHVAETSARVEPTAGPMPPVPAADDPGATTGDHPIQQVLQTVAVPDGRVGVHRAWVRPRGPFPDDPALGPGVLAYLADSVLSVPAILLAGGQPGPTPSASLDFAMWFHRPVPDGWLLFDSSCTVYGGARGLTRLEVRTPGGELVATAAQEVLVRQTGR